MRSSEGVKQADRRRAGWLHLRISWQECLPHTRFWRAARGWFRPPVETSTRLGVGLVRRFTGSTCKEKFVEIEA